MILNNKTDSKILYNTKIFRSNFFTKIKKYLIVKNENIYERKTDNKIIELKLILSLYKSFNPRKLAPAMTGIER